MGSRGAAMTSMVRGRVTALTAAPVRDDAGLVAVPAMVGGAAGGGVGSAQAPTRRTAAARAAWSDRRSGMASPGRLHTRKLYSIRGPLSGRPVGAYREWQARPATGERSRAHQRTRHCRHARGEGAGPPSRSATHGPCSCPRNRGHRTDHCSHCARNTPPDRRPRQPQPRRRDHKKGPLGFTGPL